jgi:hypothetical protein
MRFKLLLLSLAIAFSAHAQTPANNDCSNAMQLTSGSTCTNTAATLANATASPSITGCSSSGKPDVWFKFTATQASHKIKVEGSGNFDPVIQVLNGGCTAASLACVDDNWNTNEEVILNQLTTGQTYFFRVYHYSSTPTTAPNFNVCITNYAYPVISLSNQTNQNLCGGSGFSVPFTFTGTVEPSNEFVVDLSDANGSFANARAIGWGTTSPINATVPRNIPSGAGYKVRVRSTKPAATSPVSTYSLNIKVLNIALSSTNGESYTINVAGGVAPYQYSTNGSTYSASNIITNLAGNQDHTIYVRDASGCTETLSYRVNNTVKCNNTTLSGGKGVVFSKHSLGAEAGKVIIDYDMASVAHQMDVYLNGVLVASTQNPVSTYGKLSFDYDPATGARECFIRISRPYATSSGNSWNYTVACPDARTFATIGSTPVTTCNYILQSPGFPGNYSNNTSLVQTISPAQAGKMIKLSFESFHTEWGSDFVYVYNGTTTSAPLLGTYSGNRDAFSVTANNPEGALTIRFVSDGSITYTGWQAEVSCVEPLIYTAISNGSITTCSTVLGSPNYGESYASNSDFTQTIIPADAGKMVEISFLDFKTESSYDFVKIYDGRSTSSPLLATYAGTTLPGKVVAQNAEGILTITFTSDNNYELSGWLAEVKCVDRMPTVEITNGSLTTCNTIISSPRYPLNYANNTNIIQTLVPATQNSKVMLTFRDFILENNYDFLYVYDGSNTDAPLIGQYTGNRIPNEIIASNANGTLTLKFTTDESANMKGFAIEVNCKVSNSTDITSSSVSACGGSVTSPYFPSNYLNNTNITTVITPAIAGSKVSLLFNSFTVEAGFDYLHIYDGATTSAPLLKSLTGNAGGEAVTATNASGQLTLQFITDESTTARGWQADMACDAVTGLAGASARVLSYYPNPARGVLYVKAENFGANDYSIKLTDLMGREVYRYAGKTNNMGFDTEINTSAFKSGIYVLSVYNGTTVTSYKVAIEK